MRKRINALVKTLKDDECALISSYANIFYFSGFTSEDAYLLISKNDCFIITDSRYFVQAKQQCPDFMLIDISKNFDNTLNQLKEKNILFEEKNVSVGFYLNLKKKCSDKCFVPAEHRISKFREIKDEAEISKIKCAEELGDAAFSHVLNYIKPGVRECDIALELEFFMRKNGAEKLSFDTVAASGKRSAMPHGVASSKIIEYGEFLTLDFGCVLDGYCSDMTRTVAIGKINDEQKNIYNIVLKAQEKALSCMKTGMKCSEIDSLSRDVIVGAGYGDHFGHSLGHSVGIEIHENPNFSPKSDDIFVNGNVITVEPGIYIEDFCGVRIEDVVAAIDGEIINLTKSPKELIIL